MATTDDFVVDFPTLGILAVEWVAAHCPIPDGFAKGDSFVMYDWQQWCTANHYRLRPDAQPAWKPVSEGGQLGTAFVNRRSQVVAPQKTGKGPWSATIICVEAVGPALFAGWAQRGDAYECDRYGCPCGWGWDYNPGEPMGMPWPTPLIQLLATAEDQVANVYRPLQSMVKNGPLGALMKVGEDFIRTPNDGRIDVVTSSASSRLGNPTTFALQDESGLYTKQNRMVTVAETQRRGVAGMSGRSMETTNAWDPTVDSTARRTSESDSEDIFRFHRLPPTKWDYSKTTDRARIHRFVYRGSNHVDLNSIEAEAAEIMALDPAQAERFFGNRPTAGIGKAFDADTWKSLADPTFTAPKRSIVVAGVDGARFHDALAMVATDVTTGFQWPLAIIEEPIDPPTDYEHDFERADRAMLDFFATYRPWRVYVDPQYIEPLFERWTGRWGDKRIMAWYTYRQRPIGEALRRYREAMGAGDLSHDGNPVMAAHIGNAVRTPMTVKDDKGRFYWTLNKPEPRLKIDAAMAGALSWEARGDAIEDGQMTPRQPAIPRRLR